VIRQQSYNSLISLAHNSFTASSQETVATLWTRRYLCPRKP